MPTLSWIGKSAVVKHHKDVPFRLLEPVPELSCGDPESGNLIVQGDNLHALKALLPRYAGQVKCIYIDPPYNTGNEKWSYNDNVNSPEIRKWLGEVVGGEGETLDRHDRWLCMMYPRLVLLKQFMRKDGLLFISIDDNEVSFGRALLDEIFDRNNFVASFVWHTEGHTDNQFPVKVNHEYILCYARDAKYAKFGYVVDPNTREMSNLWQGFAENSITKNGTKNPPSEIDLPAGFPIKGESIDLDKSELPDGLIEAMRNEGVSSNALKRRFGKVKFPIRFDPMKGENGMLVAQCRVFSGWANANKLREFIANGCKPIAESDGQMLQFYLSTGGVIYYLKNRSNNARNITSVLRNMGTTERMRSELSRMGIHFDYPKPKELIKYLLRIGSEKGDLILDSFAGSGTTAHATMEMSVEDDGRRFIVIEMQDNTASNVLAKRLSKVSSGYTDINGNIVSGTNIGFQYLHLSNDPIFDEEGAIRTNVTFDHLAEFVWFMETGTGLTNSAIKKGEELSPFLGIHKERAVFLLFNGILKDKSDKGGNVLNRRTLEYLDSIVPEFTGPYVVYGARSRYDKKKCAELGITFHQLPYSLSVKSWY